MNGEHKITSSHRDRTALIYLRQSSMAQVREHTESTRSQYALAETAAALGWARSDIPARAAVSPRLVWNVRLTTSTLTPSGP